VTVIRGTQKLTLTVVPKESRS